MRNCSSPDMCILKALLKSCIYLIYLNYWHQAFTNFQK